MNAPQPSAESFELLHGAIALPRGVLWLSCSKAIVAADAHLGYEDVIGGALPLWSTTETTQTLLVAARRMQAEEIIFLGDIIHSTRMSAGAAHAVDGALELLRKEFLVTLVAGNHEGRSRGVGVLGETQEAVERDGWLLLHGNEPVRGRRCIIGHLHPSLPLDDGYSIPVFLAAAHLIVVPALTPYSSGLNVLSAACTEALREFGETSDLIVVAATDDRIYPFGNRQDLQRITLQTARYDESAPFTTAPRRASRLRHW